jgi:predicted dehydrogenase
LNTLHKIAIVGCGGVSRMHFEAYQAHPERVHVVAACDVNPERVAWAQSEYGVPQGFTSIEAAVAEADWEVAVVSTPTHVREAAVTALAKAGKHIMVEKPMANSYAEARRLVETCEEAGVTLAVNQIFPTTTRSRWRGSRLRKGKSARCAASCTRI